MKFCPTCGKQLQFENAEICPACGVRIAGPQNRGLGDRVILIFLAAIFIVLSVIAVVVLQLPPSFSGKDRIVTLTPVPATTPKDSSVSIVWDTMDDWSQWEHAATWSGQVVGPCSEYGPVIVQGHGEYGADVNLNGGSTESSIWRTFSDPFGYGWNTLTLVGRLPAVDLPGGRWMKIEVNDQVVFRSDGTRIPPGNWDVFTLPVHFPQSKTVKVKISNGQKPAWGGGNHPFRMDYYSLRLSLDNNLKTEQL
jgi:hypothetical protein